MDPSTPINAKYLAAARVKCPSDHALNSFEFEQRRNAEFRYNYACTHLKEPLQPIILKTPFVLWGVQLPNFGSINYLVTHS